MRIWNLLLEGRVDLRQNISKTQQYHRVNPHNKVCNIILSKISKVVILWFL